jgi:hypothetical protein
MDDAKQQLIDRLSSANNILVTVSHDPSIDQLASCIGLTLLLNKQGKHAAAVFSGKVPSTLEFLQPDDTLEKNTDSLRDFIISLDKAKADKLRYKVEEDVVRIFITPYKTSLSEADLEFSEGDFNVDVVVALGVKQQEDLDEAITAHGRILHDATVTSINTTDEGGLGTINWHDPQASSLSELITDLIQALDADLLDGQIATALLTGIVSETGRFSNDRTSSQTMSASALLLSAGANQQLVASKLESGEESTPEPAADSDAGESPDKGDDGVLQIDHAEGEGESNEGGEETPPEPEPQPEPEPESEPEPEPKPEPPSEPPAPSEPASSLSPGARLITEPPKITAAFNANTEAEHLEPAVDPMGMPTGKQPDALDHKPDEASAAEANPPQPPAGQPEPPAPPKPEPEPEPKPAPEPLPDKTPDNFTLSDLEKSVDSPHLKDRNLDSVRSEVDQALAGTGQDSPIKALNAQPLGENLHPPQPPAGPPAPSVPPTPPAPAGPGDSVAPSTPPKPDDSKEDNDPNAPPPVPPPIPFQFGNPPSPPQ